MEENKKRCPDCFGYGSFRVSDCCNASPRGNGDCDTSDFGICPECREHCEYIELVCGACHGTGEVDRTEDDDFDDLTNEADARIDSLKNDGLQQK